MPLNKQNKDAKFFYEYGMLANRSTQVFEKNLARFKPRYNDPFEYLSINRAGLKKFFSVFKQAADNPIKQFERFKRYIDKMLIHINNAYDIENWKLILLNRKPVGILMPHVFKENPELGSILNIGLIPEERGKGYGKIIHAKGLELLKKMGAKKYMGSTDLSNHAMLKIFKVNGCRKLT